MQAEAIVWCQNEIKPPQTTNSAATLQDAYGLHNEPLCEQNAPFNWLFFKAGKSQLTMLSNSVFFVIRRVEIDQIKYCFLRAERSMNRKDKTRRIIYNVYRSVLNTEILPPTEKFAVELKNKTPITRLTNLHTRLRRFEEGFNRRWSRLRNPPSFQSSWQTSSRSLHLGWIIRGNFVKEIDRSFMPIEFLFFLSIPTRQWENSPACAIDRQGR